MPTTRFLFWNLNRKPLFNAVAELAHERKVDIVILAEVETHISAIFSIHSTMVREAVSTSGAASAQKYGFLQGFRETS